MAGNRKEFGVDDYVYSQYEYSHSEIGKRMNLTRNEVRSIERRAMEKIKIILSENSDKYSDLIDNLFQLNIPENKIQKLLQHRNQIQDIESSD